MTAVEVWQTVTGVVVESIPAGASVQTGDVPTVVDVAVTWGHRVKHQYTVNYTPGSTDWTIHWSDCHQIGQIYHFSDQFSVYFINSPTQIQHSCLLHIGFCFRVHTLTPTLIRFPAFLFAKLKY